MKHSLKMSIAAILMAALIGTTAAPVMAAEAITNTTAGQISSLEAAEAGYRDMIERYRCVMESGYDRDLIKTYDVNFILGMTDSLFLDYALIDLAQDGVPELFIGSYYERNFTVNQYGWRKGGYEFYDIFGYENGEVKRLFPQHAMGYKDRFHLMHNGVLLNTISSGAYNNLMGYYVLGANSATPYLSEFVEYDGWYGDQFFGGQGNYDDYYKTLISKVQRDKVVQKYSYVRSINWYPIDNTAALHQALRSFSIPVYVNNSELACDQPAVARNGRTLVPLRAIFEALGATVEWNGVNQTITAVKGNTTVRMRLNGTTMSKNGQIISLDVPPQAIGGRTMVPVRAIADAFNYNVSWDSVNRIVSING